MSVFALALSSWRSRRRSARTQERQGGDVRLHADQPRLGRGSDRGEEVRGQARTGRSEDRTGWVCYGQAEYDYVYAGCE